MVERPNSTVSYRRRPVSNCRQAASSPGEMGTSTTMDTGLRRYDTKVYDLAFLTRVIAVILIVITQTSCGFQPLYQPASPSQLAQSPLYQNVFISTIADRPGQMLRLELQDKLTGGRSLTNADYRLDVELEQQTRFLAIKEDATAAYGRLELIAYYKVIDTRDGTVLQSDRARAEAGYSVVDSEYATLKAAEDAREKAVLGLAESLSRRLLLQN